MNQLEAGATRPDSTPPEQPRGREALSSIEAMQVQLTLMRVMAPEKLRGFFGFNTTGDLPPGVEDALFTHWIGKYAVLFNKYCDEHADDTALIKRLKSNSLTGDDIREIETYVQSPEHANAAEGTGGPFFSSEGDIDDIVRPYLH